MADVAALGLCAADADCGVEVLGAGVEVKTLSGTGWNGVRGQPGILHGAYQFDVKLTSPCLVRVGWATLTAKRVLGNDATSFGYGGTAKKSTARKYTDYGEVFQGKVGTVVSCLIDRSDPDNQTMSFCVNGRHMGCAFQIPKALNDQPLFPAVCGKDVWEVRCCFEASAFSVDGYSPLGQALARGDAAVGPAVLLEPPKGVLVGSRDHSDVIVGSRVVLHVLSGPWQGWYVCSVEDTDEHGCYLRHEQDDYTENVPWSYLAGEKYRMELLQSSFAFKAKGPRAQLRFATELLRQGQLAVSEGGAGIQLSCCEAGYFVEQVDAEPGQPDLRRGFVIVAIGGRLLLALDADAVEERFAAACQDGVPIVVGPYHELRRQPFAAVRKEVLKLLGFDAALVPSGLQRTRLP